MMEKVPRVYTLGSSPLSSLIGYEIARLVDQPKVPNVVLLLKSQDKMNRFVNNDSTFTVNYKLRNQVNHRQFMVSCKPPMYDSGQAAKIDNMIVSEPTRIGLFASMKKYSKCFDPSSNILLINPEVGSVQFLYNQLWKHPDSRPNLFVGITNDGLQSDVQSTKEFSLNVLKDTIPLKISAIPVQFNDYTYEDDVMYSKTIDRKVPLMGLLSRNTQDSLSCHAYSSTRCEFVSFGESFLFQLEKLIINTCIDSLTVLFDCQYHYELLKCESIDQMILMLTTEQCNILKKGIPYLRKIENSEAVLQPERLMNIIKLKLSQIDKHTSKFVLASNRLNHGKIVQQAGYFVRLANFKHMSCKLNQMIMLAYKTQKTLNKYRALDSHRYYDSAV